MVVLNEQQQLVVDHANGPLLVLACPGSGKTRCIVERIITLLEDDVNPNSIVAVTFTNKAANEMKARIKERGYGYKLSISTFHSLCVRILRKYGKLIGYKSNFNICDSTSQKNLIKKITKECGFDISKDKYCPKYLISILERKRNYLLSNEEFELHLKPDYIKIFRKYEKILKLSNTMDFGELIYNTVKLFDDNEEIRDSYAKRIEHLLVDEMQDTNKAQLILAKHLASYHNNIIAVGDNCQSIYGWRGACIDNIERFDMFFKNAKTIHLNINYRSTPEILSCAQKLISSNEGDLKTSLNAKRKSNGITPKYDIYDDTEIEAREIADKIINCKWNGYNYDDMAILCRTNALTRTFEEVFREREIPYKLIGSFSFYDRKEVKDAISFMKFISNPNDIISFEHVVNIPPKGIGPATLSKIMNYAHNNKISFIDACLKAENIKGITSKASNSLSYFIHKTIKSFDKRDPYHSLIKIFEDTKFLDYYRSIDYNRHEHREDNIIELLNGFYKYCKKNIKPSIDQYLQNIMLISSVDQENDGKSVSIMTCHASKGLEFNVVFIPGLEEDIFPHKRSIRDNNVAEERRVCYVAITRCKDKLFLSSVKNRAGDNGESIPLPSRFLVDMGIITQKEWEGYFG